jgi:hypothetical protein
MWAKMINQPLHTSAKFRPGSKQMKHRSFIIYASGVDRVQREFLARSQLPVDARDETRYNGNTCDERKE